jgi:hypothetical protein
MIKFRCPDCGIEGEIPFGLAPRKIVHKDCPARALVPTWEIVAWVLALALAMLFAVLVGTGKVDAQETPHVTAKTVPPQGSCHYINVIADGGPAGCKVVGEDPDPSCTPGEWDVTLTVEVLCSEGQSRRYKPDASVAQGIAAAWGQPKVPTKPGQPDKYKSCGEVDHFIPLSLGGTNGPKNLWCQPSPDWKHKDVIEAEAWREMCAGKLTPEGARAMVKDWRAEYAKRSQK